VKWVGPIVEYSIQMWVNPIRPKRVDRTDPHLAMPCEWCGGGARWCGPWRVWRAGAGRAGHLVWRRRRCRSAAGHVRWESSKEQMACSKKTLAIVIVPLLMALLASAVLASQGSRALLGAEQCSKSDNCNEQSCAPSWG
jgi:hypothetical protein